MPTRICQALSNRKLILAFLLTLLAVAVICTMATSDDAKLNPPWDQVKEYALKGHMDPSGCCVEAVQVPNGELIYGMLYCQDGSISVQRRTPQGHVSVARFVTLSGAVKYAIYDHVSRRMRQISEKEAAEIVYKCFREMVQEKLI